MQLLCPACHTPLAAAPAGQAAVACPGCALEVDLSRLGTLAGKPRYLPERDRTGTAVGGYRVEARLGSGGMGHVYRAGRDAPAGRELVAVKFLAAGLAGDADLRARFLREVRVLQGLAHPAIVRVLDSGEADGVPWFAMSLAAGPSLRTRLAEQPLSATEARAVFARVLSALEHAHGQGVIHRDLKPGNVLLGPEGAVLADFGIAWPGEAMAAPMTRLTETAAILGTLPYMSPEQRAGAALDRRSDLFSVGVMLYEALTGSLPQGAFAPPSQVRPGLTAKLDRVVNRLLQPRAQDRFATAAEAARALDAALAPTRRRTLRLAASTAGAAAALGLAALGGLSRLDRPAGPVKSVSTATPRPATAASVTRPTDPLERKPETTSPGAAGPAPANQVSAPPPRDEKALLLGKKSQARPGTKQSASPKGGGPLGKGGGVRRRPAPIPKAGAPTRAMKPKL